MKKAPGCACGAKRVLVLAAPLSRDVLPCARCENDVAVDSIKLPGDLGQKLRRWVDQRYAIELLWFASAEYEGWSKGELDNPKSPINKLGAELAKAMNAHLPTYLWFAPHAGAEQYVDRYLDPCPLCQGITEAAEFGVRFGRHCPACRIIGPGE